MSQNQLVKLLEQKNIVIPLLFFKNYKKINITLEEFIFLMYLNSKGTTFPFNPNNMEEELGIKLKEILSFISTLTEKKLLVIDTLKNEKGMLEEYIDISLYYEKMSSIISEDLVLEKEKTIDSSIFSSIEKEFGKSLNPSEIEYIKTWAQTFDSGVILEAVKEAVLNGVSSIRYIDKILYEWSKKGLKTSEEVKHYLTNKNEENKEPVEVFDYDWFDDDE